MNEHTRDLMFSSKEIEYGTPRDLFEHYNRIYSFTLDVCASAENAKVPENYFTKEENCLIQDWGTNVCWMNPPYNKPENPCPEDESKCKKKGCEKRGYHIHDYYPGQIDFIRKAAEAAERGATVVCLIPARTDTEIFHDFIWDQEQGRFRDGVKGEFIEGRIIFDGASDPAPFPSMIVVFEPKEIDLDDLLK